MGLDSFKTNNEEDASSNTGGSVPSYSKEQLIKILKDANKELDKLTLRNINKAEKYPSVSPFKTEFGSWNNAMKEAGLTPEQRSTSSKYRENVAEYQHSIIEGCILGDGSVTRNGPSSFIQVSNSKRTFLTHILNNLPDDIIGDNPISSKKSDDDETRVLKTLSKDWINNYRDRWYNKGQKKVPDKFTLDKINLLYWYLGDGHLRSDDTPSLSASWTSEYQIEKLKDDIEDIVGQATLYDKSTHYEIRVNAKHRQQFFNTIGPCPTKEYQYKWI